MGIGWIWHAVAMGGALAASNWATKKTQSSSWVQLVATVVGMAVAAGWSVVSAEHFGAPGAQSASAFTTIAQGLSLLSWAALLGLLSALAVIDAATYLLPNVVMWPSYALFGASLLTSWVAQVPGDFTNSLLAAAISFLIFAVLALITPAGLGWGDVKYVLPVAGVVGWWGVTAWGQAALCTAFIGGLAAVVVLGITRDRKASLPFGPVMWAGAILGGGLTSALGA